MFFFLDSSSNIKKVYSRPPKVALRIGNPRSMCRTTRTTPETDFTNRWPIPFTIIGRTLWSGTFIHRLQNTNIPIFFSIFLLTSYVRHTVTIDKRESFSIQLCEMLDNFQSFADSQVPQYYWPILNNSNDSFISTAVTFVTDRRCFFLSCCYNE